MSIKILTYDIETAPKLANVWDIWNQNIPISMIMEDGYILSWAAKWLGSEEIISDSLIEHDNDLEKEGDMIAGLYDLMEEADVLIGYNSDKFDRKHVNTAFLKAGLTPPSTSKSIDLFKVVKSNFKFTSNKLDFILGKLGIKQKMNHRGFALWKGCMEGDQECWTEMVEYNEQDVEVTELLYKKLLPWIKNHPCISMYTGDTVDESPICNNCGSTKVNKRGIEPLKFTSYQRYKCNDCGNNMRGKELMNTSAKRKSILVNV
tara:strand:- start:543 stop:1325 length:783 start_codon:yes stop_codon:yes gene_type:complete